MANEPQLRWTMDKIDYAAIDVDRMRREDDLMCLLCASSFVESGSDKYTQNLIEHYQGDAEVQAWLSDHWQHEELQHGRALAAYVRCVWPDFDWDAAFESFFAEYVKLCTVENLESSRCLEMAARCVVETGTSTLYRAIHDLTDEPVLKDLTNHIKSDEQHHYSYFYHYFQKYQSQQHHGRAQVARALWKRLREISNEDTDIAIRHVFKFRHPEYLADKATFKRVNDRIYGLVRSHIPADMAVKMLIRPLNLSPRVHRGVQRPLTWAARRMSLH